MATRQSEATFYVPKAPRIVPQLTITLTPQEQQVYNAVMGSADIGHLQVEIQTAAWVMKYDHDFFNLCENNYTTYPALVNQSK